jgi:hypothetical protein
MKNLPLLMTVGAFGFVFDNLVSANVTTAADSFPARIPPKEHLSNASVGPPPPPPVKDPPSNTDHVGSGGSSDDDTQKEDDLDSRSSSPEKFLPVLATSSSDRTAEAETSYPSSKDSRTDPFTSQPLQTLHKLQQMLDETDYMTARQKSTDSLPHAVSRVDPDPAPLTSVHSEHNFAKTRPSSLFVENTSTESSDKLWTSKDRLKYKKQQLRMRKSQTESTARKAVQNAVPLPRDSPPIFHFSLDDDASEDADDGMGYILANTPVYFSDAEGESETDPEPVETPIGGPPTQPFTQSTLTYPYGTNNYAPLPRAYYPPQYGAPSPPDGYSQHHYQHHQQEQLQQQLQPPYMQASPLPYMYPPNSVPYYPSYYSAQQQHPMYWPHAPPDAFLSPTPQSTLVTPRSSQWRPSARSAAAPPLVGASLLSSPGPWIVSGTVPNLQTPFIHDRVRCFKRTLLSDLVLDHSPHVRFSSSLSLRSLSL